MPARWFVVVAGLALWPGTARAQGYRVRLDLHAQGAAYRGVGLDSIPVGQVTSDPAGRRFTPDGIAVRCQGNDPFCRFFRAGPSLRAVPLTTTANFALWGVGVPGLSFRGTARVGYDLGDAGVWPGTEPHTQLLEGYAEYAGGPVTVQAGRAQAFSRLGAVGYDGGKLTARAGVAGLEASVYGGYSLARASALPLTSPALNPLDDYMPRERFLLAGGEIAVASRWGEARGVYQRQVDPASDYFASERVGVNATVRPPLVGLVFAGGADYDMGRGLWGTAEGALTYTRGPVAGTVGARFYRPYFDLWTIWGVFSPVPYRALNGALRVSPLAGLALSARGETYDYAPAEADAPLAEAETGGWRWSAGAHYLPANAFSMDAGVRVEYGPGAASRGFDASATWRGSDRWSVTVQGAALERPLEFRFDQAQVWILGARAEWTPRPELSVSAGASRYRETRERPDAAALDWNQVRVFLRAGYTFNSGADRTRLPPARRPGGTP